MVEGKAVFHKKNVVDEKRLSDNRKLSSRRDPARSPKQLRMQNCLDRLGISLKVKLVPKPNSARHGEIVSDYLLIYDEAETDAWETLCHEIVEYKLKSVTQVYRMLVNQLIEGYEKLAYQQKERFIKALPEIFETIEAERPTSNNRSKKA